MYKNEGNRFPMIISSYSFLDIEYDSIYRIALSRHNFTKFAVKVAKRACARKKLFFIEYCYRISHKLKLISLKLRLLHRKNISIALAYRICYHKHLIRPFVIEMINKISRNRCCRHADLSASRSSQSSFSLDHFIY